MKLNQVGSFDPSELPVIQRGRRSPFESVLPAILALNVGERAEIILEEDDDAPKMRASLAATLKRRAAGQVYVVVVSAIDDNQTVLRIFHTE